MPATPTTFPPDAAVFTLREAAAYLRVGYKFVHKLVRSGELRSKKVGSHYRVPRAACDAWLDSDHSEQLSA